jgi:DNA invertase Pin-like site-specific DNA recombinase
MSNIDHTFGGRIRPKKQKARNWQDLLELPNQGRAFVYQRLSSHEQVRQNIYSLKAQDALVDLAREDGYTDEQVYVEKRDLGISGTKGQEEREGLAHLIACIEQDLVESVYVVHISRLFRDQTLIDALTFGELCKKHDIIIVTPHIRLNLQDRMHMRLYRSEVERAADELELMQSRLGSARDLKGRQGYYSGENLPTGYIVDTREEVRVDGTMVPNEGHEKMRPFKPHADVVQLIFQLAMRGKTPTQIVRYCANNGIAFPPFPPGLNTGANLKNFRRLRKNLDGCWPLTTSRARSILTNPAYIGWRIWGGEVIHRDDHTPLVDEETFWAVQEQFNSCITRPKRDAPPLPLAGILYCGAHDAPRRMLYCNSKEGPSSSYQCRSHYPDGHCCKISANLLDGPVGEAVIRQCAYPEMAGEVIAKLNEQSRHVKARKAASKRQIRTLETEVANLEKNFVRLELSSERASWIEQEIQMRRSKISQIASSDREAERRNGRPAVTDIDIKLVKQFLSELHTAWDDQPNSLKNTFLSIVLDRVVVHRHKEHLDVEIYWQSGLVQKILVRRHHAKRSWTDEEDAILLKRFEESSIPELLGLLPGRSWSAIHQHARRALELSRPDMKGGTGRRYEKARRWSSGEDATLREYYTGNITWAVLRSELDRSSKAIRARAHRLGLKRTERPRWDWVDEGMMVTKHSSPAPPG